MPPEIELAANGKSESGREEDLPQIEMKTSDGHEKEGNHDAALEFSKGLRVEVKDLPTDTW